jgi:hypothetical protein
MQLKPQKTCRIALNKKAGIEPAFMICELITIYFVKTPSTPIITPLVPKISKAITFALLP